MMSSGTTMETDFNFPHRLHTCDSVLLPPSKEDIEALLLLTAGPFTSEQLMLVDSMDQVVNGIDPVGFSDSLLMNEGRGSKAVSHPNRREYFSIDSPTFRPCIEDKNQFSLTSSSLKIVDVENLIPFIIGEPGASDRRHHLDPDELLTLAVPQGRESPEKMLQQTSRPVPLKNAVISQKTSTCSAA